jgi:hypothetical protein
MDSLLEWEDRRVSKGKLYRARTPLGSYIASKGVYSARGWVAEHTHLEFAERADALEKAQQFCEADFARRLMEVPAVRRVVEAGQACVRIHSEDNVALAQLAALDEALGVFGGEDA